MPQADYLGMAEILPTKMVTICGSMALGLPWFIIHCRSTLNNCSRQLYSCILNDKSCILRCILYCDGAVTVVIYVYM